MYNKNPITNPLQRILPEFRLIEDHLLCDEVALDLSRRPLTKKLVAAFLDRPDQFLNRQELVDIVYSNFGPETKSRRFNEALKQNITKMVSRARALAELRFNQGQEPWIEMFVYIQEEEGWCFFRLKNQYIARRECNLKLEPSPHPHDNNHRCGPTDPTDQGCHKINLSLAA